jgi:tight adherence protein B
MLPFLAFLVGAGLVLGGYAALTALPGFLERRKLEQRLRDVSTAPGVDADAATVVKRQADGVTAELDRLVSGTAAGSRLARLIEQSGCRTTPAALVLMSLAMAAGTAFVTALFVRQPIFALVGAACGGVVPFAFVRHRRSRRMRTFEEQFPEALDLLSRALRAGHAFQTAIGMIAEEMKEPVGPEFKKTFDQQNFGLPLRDALNQLAERIPILDVRFFVTAVVIQRETGGNLSEILDNLAHVVRERFKICRQVRVHTAHGRFTAFVLLSLPPTLAAALTMLNSEHMQPLFHEHMGVTMLVGASVMQVIGFFWIRKVIKIEV